MIHDQFLTHTVNVSRVSSSLSSSSNMPINLTVNETYVDPAIVEIEIVSGTTASFLITGTFDGSASTETIVFTDNGINIKASLECWDGISTIVSTGGNTPTATIKLVGLSGQPMSSSEQTNYVYQGLKCRLSQNDSGLLNINFGISASDKTRMFTILGLNTIKEKDEVTDTDTGDVYTVTDVDEIYDYDGYHHTESILALK